MGSDSDTFMFDVTNGIHSLHGIDFVFEIIPKVIPLDVQDFVVIEGGHKQITGKNYSHLASLTSSSSILHTQYPSHPASFSLHGIDFVFEIIPKVIPLDVQDFVVIEGGHKQITGNSNPPIIPASLTLKLYSSCPASLMCTSWD